MGTIVPLSNGNSAELRAPGDLSERRRRPVTNLYAQISPEGQIALEASSRLTADAKEKDPKKKLTEVQRRELQLQAKYSAADIELLTSMNDQAIVAFVKHWSFDKAITLDEVLDLPSPDYDALRKAVAPLTGELFVNFAPSADPDSPTEPSSGSATRSEGEPQTDSRSSGELINSSRSA